MAARELRKEDATQLKRQPDSQQPPAVHGLTEDVIALEPVARYDQCQYCGGKLHTCSKKVLIDPRGVVFARPVDAVVCEDCGRMYAAPNVWAQAGSGVQVVPLRQSRDLRTTIRDK